MAGVLDDIFSGIAHGIGQGIDWLFKSNNGSSSGNSSGGNILHHHGHSPHHHSNQQAEFLSQQHHSKKRHDQNYLLYDPAPPYWDPYDRAAMWRWAYEKEHGYHYQLVVNENEKIPYKRYGIPEDKIEEAVDLGLGSCILNFAIKSIPGGKEAMVAHLKGNAKPEQQSIVNNIHILQFALICSMFLAPMAAPALFMLELQHERKFTALQNKPAVKNRYARKQSSKRNYTDNNNGKGIVLFPKKDDDTNSQQQNNSLSNDSNKTIETNQTQTEMTSPTH